MPWPSSQGAGDRSSADGPVLRLSFSDAAPSDARQALQYNLDIRKWAGSERRVRPRLCVDGQKALVVGGPRRTTRHSRHTACHWQYQRMLFVQQSALNGPTRLKIHNDNRRCSALGTRRIAPTATANLTLLIGNKNYSSWCGRTIICVLSFVVPQKCLYR